MDRSCMSAENAEGLILRVTDFSETSRIVVLFTRQFGKISALAKGGRRLKGPFESALDLLATCQIVFLSKNTSGLDLLTEAKLIQRFRPLERDLNCLYAGYYVAELLLGLTEDYDPHVHLYSAAQEALESYSVDGMCRLGILRFELMVLREIGQLPDFEMCVACGSDLTCEKTLRVSISLGGLICPDCRPGEQGHDLQKIEFETTAVLRFLSGDDEQEWRNVRPSPRQLQEMKFVTTTTLTHILGRRPKMLKYLN